MTTQLIFEEVQRARHQLVLNYRVDELAFSTAYWYDTDGIVSTGTADSSRAYLGVQLEEEVDHSEGGAREFFGADLQ